MTKVTQVSRDIVTIDHFFDDAECDELVQFASGLGFEYAPINGQSTSQKRPDLRNNSRVLIDDEERARDLWKRISDFVPANHFIWSARGLNERLRVYRYEKGERFDWHGDGAFHRPNGEQSFYTFMVYLNEDFEGGATQFDRLPDVKKANIRPRTGTAIVFLHTLWHRGEEVQSGTKYVLRTDVMYR